MNITTPGTSEEPGLDAYKAGTLDEAPSGGVWLALQAVRLTLYWLDWRGPPSPHWLRARELNVICGSRPERQAEQTSGLKAACSFL
jgi:hypothetical protein